MNSHETKVWRPILAFILFTFAITATGYFLFQRYKENIKTDKLHELGGIAELKINQVTNWMAERRGDAISLNNDPLFVEEVDHWLQQGGPDGEIKTRLIERLSSLQEAYEGHGYTSISLIDNNGQLRLSSSADETPLKGDEEERTLESIRTRQVEFSDIHWETHNGKKVLDIEIAAPLFIGKGEHAHTIGTLFFRTNPERSLFPIIQHWPTTSASAENLLVRREGDQVVYLNELRHSKNTALAMHMPLSQSRLPAAMAALGREGIVEGIDYRGVPVVCVLSKVPGTSWSMVTKIDKPEIYAPINQMRNWMAGLMIALVSAGGGIAIFWRNREIKQFEAELKHAVLEKHLDYLAKYANDIILLRDGTGKIIEFNDRALEAYGYTAEEFSSYNIADLRAVELLPPLAERLKEVERTGKSKFESIHVRKNGEKFPVEISERMINTNGDRFYQAIIRDITDRKRIEKKLQRQKTFMLQVIDTDPNQIFVKDSKGRFLLVNKSLASAFNMTPNEIVSKSNDEIDQLLKGATEYLKVDRQVIEEGREISHVEPITLPGGEQRWFLMIKKRLTMPDETIGVLGIAVDITEQKLSEMKLADSYKELQQLTSYLDNAKEAERTRIARELHDEMGATLAAMKMRVAWLSSILPPSSDILAEEAYQISSLVSDGIQTLRGIVTKLRPSLLEDIGLAATIEDCVRQFRHNSDIECILTLPEGKLVQAADQSAAIFRILQESLSNIAKHAQASKVEISIIKQDNSLLMVIEDNGIGFVQKHKEQSFGLIGIRERALIAGGEARISSTPGNGTRVTVSIPLTPIAGPITGV